MQGQLAPFWHELTSAFCPLSSKYQRPARINRRDAMFSFSTAQSLGQQSKATPAIRELIKDAGAYIAVIATENSSEAYIKGLGRPTDWSANIAMILDRKGDNFATFFHRLFEAMFKGRSMLMVWVELAPQLPGRSHPEAPDAIWSAEAGHIAFA